MRILGINNLISFNRRPTPNEEKKFQETINKAYDAMGTTDRAVITHGSCFPALNRDTYIGSPYGNAAKEYIKFLSIYGFNANQLGPAGDLERANNGIKPSPYNSSAFAKNRLFIDLEMLTTSNYGEILSKETFEKLTEFPNSTTKNYSMTDFEKADKIYNIALKESYLNYKKYLQTDYLKVKELHNEFQEFSNRHKFRLTDEAVFRVLSKQYGTDKFELWYDDLDINLIKEFDKQNIHAIERYKELVEKNKDEIELYKFEQFLATKQIRDNKQWRDCIGFKYINDLLVGCSKMDEWRYNDAFLDEYSMGAPEATGNHQIWNIPVIDPRKIFIGPDIELNTGGKFLKEKIDYALEFCDNIRIDHAMGLVDPFLIKKGTKDGKHLSQIYEGYKKLDDYYNYPRILEKIVLPTLKEHGLRPKDAIWENICSNPPLFVEIYYRNLNLPELVQLEWSRAENANQDNWFLVGSHDSVPAQEMIKRDWTKYGEAWNPLYLAGFLNQDGDSRPNERNAFCDKIASDDKERVKAKFAELMTNEKFQISFADLFGITDVTYNVGGSEREENWKARLSSDFIDKYYENLASDKPTALNIPEILKIALQAKMDMQIMSSPNPKQTRRELNEKNKPLLDELQKFSNILKEPV